ncbi:twin-arginine translocase TatA/TatE family subunit [Sulfobacillus thermosulfidooxidans]|uniref:Sec-independent protein translocase protein TatA n=2 Tax=Sulfobacillus thermosulfidooxidans TaxID=28034 RepID=A0A1W1WAM6_SULTA|nr:twin-arginine translocase TatA/TatE family subunit [Sulfobacillus thermosulfidooxidans]OLZ11926.1 preprotein translocase subunit TatA [Sulfobacillus thermosulfidooxidans]OLZ17609.1 preprotein translocase subunit TatA [Sulfobacillus thermosulfidooxidans]OLZ22390.1 preprotein translocase subunit TatA [Sulfobacillus thermosulfidooxidans]PSR28740.1 MAG: twin-arginine translocase TatA/TatE family subunit [Sulfobacillus thermosulfidooxidans]SMC03351.1 sec-independent protein translocase protein T
MWTNLLDPAHLIILLVVVLLIFGPRRLPELGSSLGKTLKMFKDAQKGLEDTSTRDQNPSLPKE